MHIESVPHLPIQLSPKAFSWRPFKKVAHRFVAVRGSDGWRSELALNRRHSNSQHVCMYETSATARTIRELVVGQAMS
jgi:hypothetical protein